MTFLGILHGRVVLCWGTLYGWDLYRGTMYGRFLYLCILLPPGKARSRLAGEWLNSNR
jgi:hypothetical protein